MMEVYNTTTIEFHNDNNGTDGGPISGLGHGHRRTSGGRGYWPSFLPLSTTANLQRYTLPIVGLLTGAIGMLLVILAFVIVDPSTEDQSGSSGSSVNWFLLTIGFVILGIGLGIGAFWKVFSNHPHGPSGTGFTVLKPRLPKMGHLGASKKSTGSVETPIMVHEEENFVNQEGPTDPRILLHPNVLGGAVPGRMNHGTRPGGSNSNSSRSQSPRVSGDDDDDSLTILNPNFSMSTITRKPKAKSKSVTTTAPAAVIEHEQRNIKPHAQMSNAPANNSHYKARHFSGHGYGTKRLPEALNFHIQRPGVPGSLPQMQKNGPGNANNAMPTMAPLAQLEDITPSLRSSLSSLAFVRESDTSDSERSLSNASMDSVLINELRQYNKNFNEYRNGQYDD